LGAKRTTVARCVAIKARVETDQRALERGKRVGDVLEGDCLAVLAAEGFIEEGAVFGNGFQFAHEFGGVGVNLFGRRDDHARLFFEVRRASVPELAVIVDCVPQGRRAPCEFDPACALASRTFAPASARPR